MLFMEFSNTRSGEEMRKIHMRDFNYGTTSSGMGYVVYRYKFFKHGTNLLKVCLFFWFLGFYGFFCLF